MVILRVSIFIAAVLAVLATSKSDYKPPRSVIDCPIGEGDDVPCAHHSCASRLDPERASVRMCGEFGSDDLGVPYVLTATDLAGMQGAYTYEPLFETFGLRIEPKVTMVADPFWVDVFTDSYLRQELPQARQFVQWNLPSSAEPTTFKPVQSGFVYLPIGAELRQVLTEYASVFPINQKSVIDLKVTYAYKSGGQEQKHREYVMASQANDIPPATIPDDLVVTDAIYFNTQYVLNAAADATNDSEDGTDTQTEMPLMAARAFVALYLSEAMAADVDPEQLIKVTRTDDGDDVVVGWSVGPDRRAVFGAMLHDDAQFDVAISKSLKGASGKAFGGVADDHVLAPYGFTVSVAD